VSELVLIGSGRSASDIGMSSGPQDRTMDWKHIYSQLDDIRNQLNGLFQAPAVGAELDSVAIEFGVTASGEVGIIVAKTTVEVGTKITMTFRR